MNRTTTWFRPMAAFVKPGVPPAVAQQQPDQGHPRPQPQQEPLPPPSPHSSIFCPNSSSCCCSHRASVPQSSECNGWRALPCPGQLYGADRHLCPACGQRSLRWEIFNLRRNYRWLRCTNYKRGQGCKFCFYSPYNDRSRGWHADSLKSCPCCRRAPALRLRVIVISYSPV